MRRSLYSLIGIGVALVIMDHTSETSNSDSGGNDHEVLALIQEGRPLSDMLKELISLRKWKEAQLSAQKKEAIRLERMLTRLCVSTFTLIPFTEL